MTMTEQQPATWQPFRCDGMLKDGRRCEKVIANVRGGTPETVRIVCDRCKKWHKLPPVLE